MAIARGLTLLLLFQLAGELCSRLGDLPIPGNVLGMGLLLMALLAGWVKVQWLVDAAELLLANLALFFVPAGVGVMVYTGLIVRQWLPITLATLLSTFVVMAVTGHFAQRLEGREKSHAE